MTQTDKGNWQCKKCNSWKKNSGRPKKTPITPTPGGSGNKGDVHTNYLRSLIPCLVCGQVPQEIQIKVPFTDQIRTVVKTQHSATCTVEAR